MTPTPAYSWRTEETPTELHSMLRGLAEEYGIVEGPTDGGISLEFRGGREGGRVAVRRAGDSAIVEYGSIVDAARGIGSLMAGVASEDGGYAERSPFRTHGIMLDCSRNAVMTVAHLKKWLRRLALLGFNMVMLYTEDTYQLDDEPYFGYLRGGYSPDELREIDRCSADLGIETIGCIQTLGHLKQPLRWPTYAKLKDTEDVLLVDEEATYDLIEKMISRVGECLRSRRIQVGMDETLGLGKGRFLDLHGHEQGYDIFNRHLARVAEICKRHELSPMIWSDMYFQMGPNAGGYYDKESVIPDWVKADIPREVQLVYWDYYHDDAEFYREWIRRHRQLDREPLLASGVWTWGGNFWYARDITERNAPPAIEAAKAEGIQEIFYTLWGDDGGFCEYDSALAGLAYVAELGYVGGDFDTANLEKRFQAVCGADYEQVMDAAEMARPIPPAAVVWDDPLLGIAWKNESLKDAEFWNEASETYGAVLERLDGLAEATEPIDFAHAVNVVRLLKARVDVGIAMEAAYPTRNLDELEAVRAKIVSVLERIEDVSMSFRRQWLRRNKPHGLEAIQLHFGGLVERYKEMSRRLGELIVGEIDSIPEWEERPSEPMATPLKRRDLASGSRLL
jgi:hypothetical protein